MKKLPIFLALDVDSKEQALSLVEKTHHLIQGYKLGPRLFLQHNDLITKIKNYDNSLQAFLDFKFYDIPSSTLEAVKTSYHLGASLVTVHCLVGQKTLNLLAKAEQEFNKNRPFKVLAVTVLSSVKQNSETLKKVEDLAEEVLASGLNSLVCSPLEIKNLRQKYPSSYLVTPGIRLEGDSSGDQQRVMTPQQALQDGSSALVMGRSLTLAKDPVKILNQLKGFLQ